MFYIEVDIEGNIVNVYESPVKSNLVSIDKETIINMVNSDDINIIKKFINIIQHPNKTISISLTDGISNSINSNLTEERMLDLEMAIAQILGGGV